MHLFVGKEKTEGDNEQNEDPRKHPEYAHPILRNDADKRKGKHDARSPYGAERKAQLSCRQFFPRNNSDEEVASCACKKYDETDGLHVADAVPNGAFRQENRERLLSFEVGEGKDAARHEWETGCEHRG